MCDMFGHGLWNCKTHNPLFNYLRFNSHQEIYSKFWPPATRFDRPLSPPLVSYGINPIDGDVTAKGAGLPVFQPLERTPQPCHIIRATWDKAFPDAKSLCPWIENHFGQRGDLQDWSMRGALMCSPEGLDRLPLRWVNSTTSDGRGQCGEIRFVLTAGHLIANFRKYPNRFWKPQATKGRYDSACRILEAAGMN